MPTEDKKYDLIKEAEATLSGIESRLRQLWPDDTPAPKRGDDDYGFYRNILHAQTHILDLHCDLDSLIDEL